MPDKILTLKYSESTKGTHVFTDDSAFAPIPTVYIKHSAFGGSVAPPSITLTLSVSTKNGS